jgi:predicted DNA binding CopG/RHH family protein
MICSSELFRPEKRIKMNGKITGGETIMRDHYDFSEMKGKRNPYIKRLKQPITIRLDKNTIDYFKTLSSQIGMPYQNLINLYLRDCALHHKKLHLNWAA